MVEVENLRNALQSFCTTKTEQDSENIPDQLEKILTQIAKAGELPWELKWKEISHVVRQKILYCIHTMDTMRKYAGGQEEFTETMDMILSQVDLFEEAPFTIQRVCELLIDPKKHYKSTDKYMRALLKNLLVVSGWRKQPDSDLPPETKIEKEDEIKFEPDSTSGVSFEKENNSPVKRRAEVICDSTNNEPDSTTEEVKTENKEIENSSDDTPFKERPKKSNENDDEIDLFDSMKKISPKRKVALSSTKIQIQVGVGKVLPKTDGDDNSNQVSSTSGSDISESSDIITGSTGVIAATTEAEPVPMEVEKPEVTPTLSEPKPEVETPPATETERKRKRSDDESPPDKISNPEPEKTENKELSTPQKLQKTE